MKTIENFLGLHAQALVLRSRRNEILASNIANAATPNFKARDIDFDTELRRAQGINPITTTHRDHINVGNGNPGGMEMKYRVPLNPALDGNTVETAVEQMQFSENVMRYQSSLSFLNNRITGLLSAIKGE